MYNFADALVNIDDYAVCTAMYSTSKYRHKGRKQTEGNNMRTINAITPEAKARIGVGIVAAQLWLEKQPEDHFYAYEINGQTYFIEQNETGSYTLLLPAEH